MNRMNEKFLYQKIKQCFLDYNHDLDVLPLPKDDYNAIVSKIEHFLKEKDVTELYVIIHDVVYDYLTV
jgi:hypothetical protein